jgi:hypothetical protein
MKFKDHDESTILNALRVAAERFDEHVKTFAADGAHQGLARQFERQAKDSRELADRIEAEGLGG